MYNRVYAYFEKFNFLYNQQFGFRTKLRTIDAIIEVTERLRHERSGEKINFFLDLKKAFYTIDHNLLIKKIERLRNKKQSIRLVEQLST